MCENPSDKSGMAGGGGSLVYVVDDDAGARQSLTSLLQSSAMRVEAFGSAADF
jgi:FixJ family two-component response regulator